MDALLRCEEIIDSPAAAWPDTPSSQLSSSPLPSSDFHFPPSSTIIDLHDETTFDFLLHHQSDYLPHTSHSSSLPSHPVSNDRCTAVRWLLKARRVLNFNPLTVALAVNYFDRYLAKNLFTSWKVWMLELLSVACLSIAAKMEEVHVPVLLDLQVDGIEHSFEGATVQRMELTVLTTLGWKLRSITPFTFAEKAINHLNLSQYLKNSLMQRTSELLLGTLPEVEFLDFPPSVTASSAICFALEENVPVQAETLKTSLFKFIPLDEEKFSNCCILMEELVVDPVSPKLYLSGHISKSPLSPTSVVPELYQLEDNSSGDTCERRLLDSRTCVRRIELQQLVFITSHTAGTKRQRRF